MHRLKLVFLGYPGLYVAAQVVLTVRDQVPWGGAQVGWFDLFYCSRLPAKHNQPALGNRSAAILATGKGSVSRWVEQADRQGAAHKQ